MAAEINYKEYQILFVDDEEFAQITFKGQFKKEFNISTTGNGEKALDLIEKEEVALVVTDQRMPGMSGVELLKHIKERKPDIVRILLTAYSDMDTVIEAINSGNIYRYLTKPYEEEEVRAALKQGLEKFHLVKERNRLYAEKLETMKKMARTNRLTAIGTFAAGMAHEIRNPLTSINTFITIAPERKDDREFLENFSKIALEDVNRISRLVQEILDYARSSEPKFSEEDLNEIIHSSLFFIGMETEKMDIRIQEDLSLEVPRIILDRQQMKQVLLNLFINAMDAMGKEGGTIQVKTHTTQKNGSDWVQIEVKDTGPGIPEDSLEHIFDPFYTTKHDSKDREGTGLGLAIVHQIIQEHGGSIEVKSEMGKGTSFIINLPVNPLLHRKAKPPMQL
ncbi:MAG TPA: ATP-binding protein [Nitrospiria bacterium]|jgi:signal transduction histidine kinase